MEEINVVEKDMTPRLIGESYLRKPSENSRQRERYVMYECQYCKGEFEGMYYNIIRGQKSCGCHRDVGKTKTHGLSKHRFYKVWHQVVRRCTNPKDRDYKDYGGRGITVCEEWLDVRNFITWTESTHPNIGNVSLDRIDNDKGYSPENCRWADTSTQAINQRVQRSNTSGYVGIWQSTNSSSWVSAITFKNNNTHLGTFKTIEEAVLARDNYILENKLPHKLSTEYVKETK